MNVTSIIETPFQVNLDSVVYAYTRGDGSSIMLSKGSVILDVAETVAELVTEAGGLLTAFTAVSGDASGDIAINPNYILTVESANGGAYSLITLCDNIYTRAKITVNTAYDDMDAIVEAAAGGSSYSVYTALLSQSDTDAPVATVLENTLGGTVVWARAETGVYTATLSGAFPVSKTGIFFGSTNAFSMNGYRISDNVINLATIDSSASAADGYLNDTIIEIRVYP